MRMVGMAHFGDVGKRQVVQEEEEVVVVVRLLEER